MCVEVDVDFSAVLSAIYCCSLLNSFFMADVLFLIQTISFMISFWEFYLAGIIYNVYMIFARAMFILLNPSLVSSTALGAFAPSIFLR